MKPSDAVALMVRLKAAYPRQTISKETIEVYARELEDLDLAVVEQACRRHTRTSQWFPTIAELRSAALKASGTSAPLVADAWAEVLRLASSVGRDGIPVFSHPAIARTVRGVGWEQICNSTAIQYEADAFRKTYGQVADDEDVRAQSDIVPIGQRLGGQRHPALPSAS